MANFKPRLFSIPASVPFLPKLIEALMHGRLVPDFPAAGDPLALAEATIYLPTRRACRQARALFLGALDQDSAVLPRIVPLGDLDEDEIAFAEAAAGDLAGIALELPEALGDLERRMLLAEQVLKLAASPAMSGAGGASLVASNPAAALALAGDLARLMDDMTTRQVAWDRLDRLVPADLDAYWQHTLRFLQIARETWPAILAERGKIEPAERRDRLIDAEGERLAHSNAPVIAAGSTGSMPATAKLLATIAGLPNGAVVLPGLDTDLDPETWKLIGLDDNGRDAAHGHPQFAMQALLGRIGVGRDAVTTLAAPAPHGREPIVSEALRPAIATDQWRRRLAAADFAAKADAAIGSIAVIEAANPEEEALAIAVALREAVETRDRTAALVTPDRGLARRVLAALARWNVPVEDSRGDDLADTPAGVFARLVAEAALKNLAPVPLLAMLKHPLCRVDRYAVATLERAVLHGTRPKSGTAGLAHALASFRDELAKLRRREELELHRSDPRVLVSEAGLDRATELVARLKTALAPLEGLGTAPLPMREIAKRHRDVVAALGELSEELTEAFDEIDKAGSLAVRPAEYAELFRAAIADRRVRSPEPDVRVRIFGPLEARLQAVDRLVLGGLVEGVWPPETRADAWLSRPMRHDLGLDLPERRIGLSAHDFAQALGAPEVFLTRASRLSGAPTVASRFVQRLAAVAGRDRWTDAVRRGERYLDYARALDAPVGQPKWIKRPEPKPPLAVRPRALSVTEIEQWLRDPYTIYARHVLRLRPLDTIDAPPGARDRGTIVHGAIGDFTVTFKDRLPDDIVGELTRLGEQRFAELEDFPDARAFWWPRFRRIAAWFADFERSRRPTIARLDAEVYGTLEIPLTDGAFTLRARADRIEHRRDGAFAILDYKTGSAPSSLQVKSGMTPQLTLEGAILRAGRFDGIPTGASIAEFLYVSLRGLNPPGETKAIKWADSTPDIEADTALRRLSELVWKFDELDTPYRSRERPMFMRRSPGDYDHLARVKEWSLSARRRRGRGRRRMSERPIPEAVIDEPARGVRSRGVGLGVGQRRRRQDPRAGAARDPPAARRHRSVENPVPHLHQGGRRQHGEPHLRDACAVDRRSTTRRSTRRSAAPACATSMRSGARRRAGCSPRRSKRRAASRCRPFTGSARGSCSSSRSRPMSRRASACWKKPSRASCSKRFGVTVLLEAAQNPDSAIGRALAIDHPDRERPRISTGLDEAMRERNDDRGLARPCRRPRRRATGPLAALGIEPGDTIGQRRSGDRLRPASCRSRNGGRSQRSVRQGSKNDRDQAERLHQCRVPRRSRSRRHISGECFCTADGDPARRSSPTAASKAHPDLARRLDAEQDRVLRRSATSAAPCWRATARVALLTIAIEVIDRYAPRRKRRGLLDYDDLIARPATCSIASSRLGALQARPRHRPSADRRGAGHEPGAVGHHQAARRRVHRRRRRARRRCGARSSPSATTSSRSFRSRALRPKLRRDAAVLQNPRTAAPGCRSGRFRSTTRSVRRQRAGPPSMRCSGSRRRTPG